MSQQNIVSGQTPLLVSDVQLILQTQDHDYYAPVDFLTPFKIALPQYAKQYTGDYYKVPSNPSSPVTFGSPLESDSNGKIFEVSVPSNCADNGITSVQLFYGSPLGEVNNLNVIHQDDEGQWDLTIPANCYWRQGGRTVRILIGELYSPSTGLAYSVGFERYPTYPSVVGDGIDVPAEDVNTFINSFYKPLVNKI